MKYFKQEYLDYDYKDEKKRTEMNKVWKEICKTYSDYFKTIESSFSKLFLQLYHGLQDAPGQPQSRAGDHGGADARQAVIADDEIDLRVRRPAEDAPDELGGGRVVRPGAQRQKERERQNGRQQDQKADASGAVAAVVGIVRLTRRV